MQIYNHIYWVSDCVQDFLLYYQLMNCYIPLWEVAVLIRTRFVIQELPLLMQKQQFPAMHLRFSIWIMEKIASEMFSYCTKLVSCSHIEMLLLERYWFNKLEIFSCVHLFVWCHLKLLDMLTTGCIRFLPIGYRYWFGFLIALDVNQRMNPDKRSNRESNVEAITANDLLSNEAYAFARKSTKLDTLDAYIAILSFLASWFTASWNQEFVMQIATIKKNSRFELVEIIL